MLTYTESCRLCGTRGRIVCVVGRGKTGGLVNITWIYVSDYIIVVCAFCVCLYVYKVMASAKKKISNPPCP